MGRFERRLGHGAVADRGTVHIGLVRQIHQVVDHQPVVALGVDVLAVRRPGRVVVPVQVRDQSRVGQRRVAHPQPDESMPLDQRIGPDAGRGIYGALRRHVYTSTRVVEFETVVAADDVVAVQLAHRQRQQPMPAGIGQRNSRSVLFSVENNGLVADGARQQVALDLDIPGSGIPGVERKCRLLHLDPPNLLGPALNTTCIQFARI